MTKPSRLVRLAPLVVVVAGAAVARADTAPFRLHAPEGWLVVEAGVAAPKDAPPGFVAAVAQGHIVWIAGDTAAASTGFTPNMNLVVSDGGGTITDAALSEVSGKLAAQLQAKEIERKIVSVHGVDAGRMVHERVEQGFTIRSILFILPGAGKKCGVVTCTCTTDQFPKYESIFDAAVRATEGVEAPPGIFDNVPRAALVGGVIGGLVVGLRALAGGGKKRGGA
jgi:hypothetical protein